ncbi:MAG: GDP-mannose 4,6-dehydratase [Gemmatimonadota bacterium]
MTVLVTGAAGFIGSHLVDRLLERGEDVVGLDSFDGFYDRAIKEANLRSAMDHRSFRLVEGDIRDRKTVAALPGSIDAVLHLAARAGVRPSIRNPVLYSDVNLMGTSVLLEFAREREIEPFVFASSSSVYGNNEKVPFSESDPADHPISPYAATKRSGELLCHTQTHLQGTTCICLRFFTVYGPRQRPDLAIRKFSRLLLSGEPLPRFGDGGSARDYTYIEDILNGVESALAFARRNEGRFEILNLGESRTVMLSEMIRVLGEVFSVTPEIRSLPPQPGDVNRTFADVSRARELLGYHPTTDFVDGMQRFAEWYLSTGVEQDGVR